MAALASLLSAVDSLHSAAPLPMDDLEPCLALADEITALLRTRAAVPSATVAASSDSKRPALAVPPAALALCELPTELLAQVVYHLATTEDVGRLHCTARIFNGRPPPPPPPPPPLPPTAVEEGLRLRAAARAIREPELAPDETMTQALCWAEVRERFGGRAKVAAGACHHAMVDAQGRLLTCGKDDGQWGVLGHGATLELAVPTLVPGLAGVRVRSVAAGDDHSLVVSDAGVVYSFGQGGGGSLGHGNEEHQRTPRVIEALCGVRVHTVAAGIRHSLAVSDRGVLYSFGHGPDGRLGHGNVEKQLVPMVVAALEGVRVCAVAAGNCHSLVVSEKGVVYSFGDGSNGQLGHGNCKRQMKPKAIVGLRGVRVRSVAAGIYHSLAVSDQGVLHSFGLSDRGELGHGDVAIQFTPKVVAALEGVWVCAVAAGDHHTLVVSDKGTLYSFGLGFYGVLGHGDISKQLTPKTVEGLRNVRMREIAGGVVTSLAVAANGAVYGWGHGDYLGLGIAEDELQLTPLRYQELQL